MLTHANLIGTMEAAHNVIPEQEHRRSRCCRSRTCSSRSPPVLRHDRRRPRALRPEPQPTGHLRGDPRPPGHHDGAWCRRSSTSSGRRSRRRSPGRAGPPPSIGCARSPAGSPTLPGGSSSGGPRQLGGSLNLIVSAAAFLPPSLQQAWEDLGVVVMQGYGATECGPASATRSRDHGLGTVGRTIPPVQVKLAEDGEILVTGPTLFSGYWRDPTTTAELVHGRRLVQDRRHRPTRRVGSPRS